MLQEFEALPRVWKFVLELYPGKEKMMAFADLPSRTEHSSQRSSHGKQPGAFRGRMSVTSASGQRMNVVSQLSEEPPRGYIDDNQLMGAYGIDPDCPFQSLLGRLI